MTAFMMILFILVCVLLIGMVLLQKGRGGGLSGAFGGAGGHSAFGSRTGDAFTWATVGLVGLFLLLGVVASKYFRPPPTPEAQAAQPAEPNATADAQQPAAEEIDTQLTPVDDPNLTVSPPPAESVEPTAPAQPVTEPAQPEPAAQPVTEALQGEPAAEPTPEAPAAE